MCLGGVILSGGADGTLIVSNALTGTVIKTLVDHRGAPITDIDARHGPLKVPTCPSTSQSLHQHNSSDVLDGSFRI